MSGKLRKMFTVRKCTKANSFYPLSPPTQFPFAGRLTLYALVKDYFGYQVYLSSNDTLPPYFSSRKFSFCVQRTVQEKFPKCVHLIENLLKVKY